MILESSYQSLPERFYEEATPYGASHPQLIIYNHELAQELGLQVAEAKRALVFSGNELLEGSKPIALAYAGHQFGHFVPSLGDGRAILLGDINGFDLQLKGSGRTFFSRNGDGKAALGPVLREYLVSEFMHKWYVPTTRSLAAVLTGDPVYRDEVKPGAMLTRVAKGHVRVGTFEYFAARGDLPALNELINYSIKRFYPEASTPLELFQAVAAAQAKLIAKWMGLGFIHGVMNTDNMSICGETIDYGPCAFMDYYQHNQVYSFIDKNGRYSFSNQYKIACWNLSRLASCLVPLVNADEQKAMDLLQTELDKLPSLFEDEITKTYNHKFGFKKTKREDALWQKLFFDHLQDSSLDFTQSFIKISDSDTELISSIKDEHFQLLFKQKLSEETQDRKLMMLNNPRVIPRNHLIERMIKEAEAGDYTFFHKFHQVLQNQIEDEDFMQPPKEEEKIKNTFCGT